MSERTYALVDRLSMCPDKDREYIWAHLSQHDKEELLRLPPSERRLLMSSRMQAERTSCCCELMYRQDVYFWPSGGSPEAFGWVACCGGKDCHKPVGELKLTGTSPKGFTSETWNAMRRQSGRFGRFYCKEVEGVCVPYASDSGGSAKMFVQPSPVSVEKKEPVQAAIPEPFPDGYLEDPEAQ